MKACSCKDSVFFTPTWHKGPHRPSLLPSLPHMGLSFTLILRLPWTSEPRFIHGLLLGSTWGGPQLFLCLFHSSSSRKGYFWSPKFVDTPRARTALGVFLLPRVTCSLCFWASAGALEVPVNGRMELPHKAVAVATGGKKG